MEENIMIIPIAYSILSIEVLVYSAQLDGVTNFPYENSKYTKDFSLITLYNKSSLKNKYHDIVEGKWYFDLLNNRKDFYWFINSDNQIEIMFFNGVELISLKKINYDDSFKLSKTRYSDRSDLKIELKNGKKIIKMMYVDKVDKIIQF